MDRTKAKIQEFIIETIKHQSWKKYNELHIDDIEGGNLEKEEWISKGKFYFAQAVNLISSIDKAYVVKLHFFISQPLSNKSNVKTILESLEDSLDPITPPSLGLMPKNSILLQENFKHYQHVGTLSLDRECQAEIVYFEKNNEYSGDKSRILIFLGNYNSD